MLLHVFLNSRITFLVVLSVLLFYNNLVNQIIAFFFNSTQNIHKFCGGQPHINQQISLTFIDAI